MKRALKWVGYVVGFLVALLIVAVGVVYAVTSSKFGKSYPTAAEPVAIPTDSASLARGRHLVEAVGKCQSCHGDDYAGKVLFDDPAFGRLTSRNLTSGQGGIGGTFTDADYVRAIRHGVGKDGRSLFFMPAEQFYHFNDADLGAMIAYLKTIPAAASTVPEKRSIGPIGRAVSLLTSFPLVTASLVPTGARPADVPVGVTKEYGEYLAKTGSCTGCHGSRLSGGNKIETLIAPNLTPAGELGRWTEADFTKAIRTGVRPDGRILSAVMPWPLAKNMTDDEIRALWMYVHSLPAKKTGEL
ncbi:MAG TPA: c-type cytochrome [Gemmatimonadaceae bacterium]|nr:c-type cytochrome [Gemmatimonadaceae bacterium]